MTLLPWVEGLKRKFLAAVKVMNLSLKIVQRCFGMKMLVCLFEVNLCHFIGTRDRIKTVSKDVVMIVLVNFPLCLATFLLVSNVLLTLAQ